MTAIAQTKPLAEREITITRLFDAPLSSAMRRANAARLMRSAHKLDPVGQILDAAARSILNPE